MVRPALIGGAALVTAMLIAALAALIVATLAAGQSQWLRTVELRRDRGQAQAIVLAGLAWTRTVLQEDARGGEVDHLGEPWSLPLPPTPLEGGWVEGSIVDAQGRLDLNHLDGDTPGARAARERVARLLSQVGLEARVLAALGARDVPWVRAAEIAALPEVGEPGYARLAPWVTALPAASPVNVNTAPAEVLATVLSGLDADVMRALLVDRIRKPFGSVAEFRSRLPSGSSVATDAGLGVQSAFFIVSVRARQGEAEARGRALLHRRGRELPEVVWQTIE